MTSQITIPGRRVPPPPPWSPGSRTPLVIYHGGCRDGFCAAYVVWRRLGPSAEFFPGYHGQPPPARGHTEGRDVYVLDFSYQRPVVEELASRCGSLLVLDHHATAEAALAGLPYARFDMSRSGAGMAWDHFFPDEPRPWFVDYVEDRDLQRHELPGTEELSAYLGVVPFDFAMWEALPKQLTEHARRHYMSLGLAIAAKVRQYVAEVSKNAVRGEFEGYSVPFVNAPQVDISELVAHLCQNEPLAVGWFVRGDGKVQYSLRSVPGGVDVSELAKRWGGGGHRHAAGFQLDGAPWELGWVEWTGRPQMVDSANFGRSEKKQVRAAGKVRLVEMRIEKRKEVGLLVHRTVSGAVNTGNLVAVVTKDGSAFLGRVREEDLIDDARGTVLRVDEEATRLDEETTIVCVYDVFLGSKVSSLEVPSSSVSPEWKPEPKTRWLRWTSMHAVGGGSDVAVRVPVGGEATEEVVVSWEHVRGPYLRVDLLSGSNVFGDVKVLLPALSVRGLAEVQIHSACLIAELPETTWAEPVKTSLTGK